MLFRLLTLLTLLFEFIVALAGGFFEGIVVVVLLVVEVVVDLAVLLLLNDTIDDCDVFEAAELASDCCPGDIIGA